MLDQSQKWSLVGYSCILGLLTGVAGMGWVIAVPSSLAAFGMAIFGWSVLLLALWRGERLLRKDKTNVR